MTGLPVDEKPDLIRVLAADAAALVGLLLEPLVLGMLRNGVGAVLSGVRGSDGAGLLLFSISASVVPRSISMPPLEECTGDTKYIQPRWMS